MSAVLITFTIVVFVLVAALGVAIRFGDRIGVETYTISTRDLPNTATDIHTDTTGTGIHTDTEMRS
jgi:hypothetical protein